MADIGYALEFMGAAIIAILVISNPLSTSAVFIALTREMSSQERMVIIRKAVTYALGILLFFSFTGLLIFQLFGFGIGAFRIAGGVLLFSTAVGMLNPATGKEAAGERSKDISLIPLAIPFISGPGTIVTVVLLMSEAQDILGTTDLVTGSLAMIGVWIGIGVVILISYYMMTESERIDAILKEGGRKVVTKLLGLIVMAISIQFIINGVKDIIPDFMEVIRESSFTLLQLLLNI